MNHTHLTPDDYRTAYDCLRYIAHVNKLYETDKIGWADTYTPEQWREDKPDTSIEGLSISAVHYGIKEILLFYQTEYCPWQEALARIPQKPHVDTKRLCSWFEYAGEETDPGDPMDIPLHAWEDVITFGARAEIGLGVWNAAHHYRDNLYQFQARES